MFEILQTLGIIVSVLGSAFFIRREIKTDHASFQEALNAQAGRIDAANARTNFLSNQIIELMKEIRK